MLGKSSTSASSGSGPADTLNSSYSPGLIVPPVHVIFETTSVISRPWLSMGVSSVRISTTCVQPGVGRQRHGRHGQRSGHSKVPHCMLLVVCEVVDVGDVCVREGSVTGRGRPS